MQQSNKHKLDLSSFTQAGQEKKKMLTLHVHQLMDKTRNMITAFIYQCYLLGTMPYTSSQVTLTTILESHWTHFADEKMEIQ